MTYALLACGGPYGHARAPVTTATVAGRLAVFDDVWTTVQMRYYDPALQGVDWPALGAQLRPRAAAAQTQAEFYAVVRRLLAPLHDAHTRAYAPGEYADWQHPRYLSTGVSLRELAGDVLVVRVERDGPAARAGVRAGDVLLMLDGVPAAPLLARRLAADAAGAPTPAARLAALAHLFDGPLETPVAAVFTRAGHAPRTVQLRRVWRERAPALSVRRVGAYAVVSFNSFTPAIVTELLRALRGDLRQTRGLVVDLRANGGGAAEAMTDLASAFLPPGTPLGQFTDRGGQTVSAPHARAAALLAADRIEQFPAPLVVLTDAHTASAAEIFVAALRVGGRARVVGEPTCGCVLGVRRRHTLPDGGALDISEMDYRTATGTRLEGAGLTPDVVLPPTRADLSTGRDPALARALALLKRN